MITNQTAGRTVPATRRSWFSRLLSLAAWPSSGRRRHRSARLDIRALSPYLQRDMGFVDAAAESRGNAEDPAAPTAPSGLTVFAK